MVPDRAGADTQVIAHALTVPVVTGHADGTSEAHSPDGHLILRSNSPPIPRAG